MKRLIIISLLLVFTAASSMAQRRNHGQVQIVKSVSVSFGGGASLFLGNNSDVLGMTDKLTPTFHLGVGAWFTDYVGVQTSVSGFKLHSSSKGEYKYSLESEIWQHSKLNPDGSFRYSINYINPSLQVCTSVAGILGFYKQCVADLVPSVGVGLFHVFENDGVPSNNALSINAGLTGMYKLLPNFWAQLKATYTLLPDDFDGLKSDGAIESLIGIQAGFVGKIKLSKGHNRRF